jgi:AMP nucleosidase
MLTKSQITSNWLPRYTGMPLDEFGEYILVTNFGNYVRRFAEIFGCRVYGEDRAMQAATNSEGLTIINYGIGSSNAATIMDLLTAVSPKGVLFLGKCGGLKTSTEIGHFILPIAALKYRPCHRSNCTNLFPTRFSSTGSITGPVLSIPPTGASGSTMKHSTKNCRT